MLEIEKIVLEIIGNWSKEISDDISVSYINSVTNFRINSFNYEYCYNVTFDFGFSGRKISDSRLLELFTNKYKTTEFKESSGSKYRQIACNGPKDLLFNNEYIDYVTDQGYSKFIVQFYPIAIMNLNKRIERDKKINNLLNEEDCNNGAYGVGEKLYS